MQTTPRMKRRLRLRLHRGSSKWKPKMKYAHPQPNSSISTTQDLSDLANRINVCFQKSESYRVTAGKYLLEAQRRVRAGEAGTITCERWLNCFRRPDRFRAHNFRPARRRRFKAHRPSRRGQSVGRRSSSARRCRRTCIRDFLGNTLSLRLELEELLQLFDGS